MDTSQLNLEKFESVLQMATKRNNAVYDNVQKVLDSLDDIFKEKLPREMEGDDGSGFLSDSLSIDSSPPPPPPLPLFSATTTTDGGNECCSLALPFGYRLPIAQSTHNEQVFAGYVEFWRNREDYLQGYVEDHMMHYGYEERYQGFKVYELPRRQFDQQVGLYYTDASVLEENIAVDSDLNPEEEEEESFTLPILFSKQRLSLLDNSLITKRYSIVTKAGQGSFSKTFVCTDTTLDNSLCCIKVLNAEFQVAVNEISTLRKLQCGPGIVQLVDFFYLPASPCLVFELLHDNLYEVAEKFRLEGGYFTEPVLQHITRQVLSALEFAHGLGIIHADLKPENIMLTEPVSIEYLPQIKVIDWGCTKRNTTRLEVEQQQQEDAYFQTRAYRAPEVILGYGFDAKIDLWSLGVILAELFTNRLFLNSTGSVPQLLASICSVCGPFPRTMATLGVFASRYFMNGFLIEHVDREEEGEEDYIRVLFPKPSCVADRLGSGDADFIQFVSLLMQVDPECRMDVHQAQLHVFVSPIV
ncbi:hypothetical protein BASA81_012360 [Batrachochytrium salamandrivorans]|nr:hypothetical protein BASA81_012360 [Batrachochytrium salamandrivorans]